MLGGLGGAKRWNVWSALVRSARNARRSASRRADGGVGLEQETERDTIVSRNRNRNSNAFLDTRYAIRVPRIRVTRSRVNGARTVPKQSLGWG